jgi:hypothetical protein
MSMAQTKMLNMRIYKEFIPEFSAKIFDLIMDNYKYNK